MTRTHLARSLAALGLTFFAGLAPAQAPQKQDKRDVELRIVMPDPTAELTIEDVRTRQTGSRRVFFSPPLEPGKTYVYTLITTWQPNNYTTITRTRKVTVRAGQTVDVDLGKADAKNPDKIVVRFVPTPEGVVDAMLLLADVGKDDVVYDLGCGDGRMVIAAVKKAEAKRGVGVDIDPQRIRESKANAKRFGVEDKVEFRQGDVLDIKDLADATVVMLYMGEELNLQLRPILQRTLKPGARIVSHEFKMGDWKPVKSQTLMGRNGEKYNIHLWKIEAKPE